MGLNKDIRNTVAVVILTIAMAGCAHKTGQQFSNPGTGNLQVGKTTIQQALSSLGEPQTKSTFNNSADTTDQNKNATDFDPSGAPGSRTSFSYVYGESQPPISGGASTNKTLTLFFFNNILVSRSFMSNFPDSSTDFDDAKIASINKDSMTKNDVIALVGQPSGEYIYPMIHNPTDSVIMYSFRKTDGAKIFSKNLSVLFDQNNHIKDIRYFSNSDQAPPPVATGTTYVPMPIIVKSK